MPKTIRYQNLLARFKKHRFSTPELLNPHEIENFDFDVINPWELWQGSLDAEIMLIGQDFADSESLKNNLQEDWKKEKSSATNYALINFFKILGYAIPEISYDGTGKLPLFFTNAILGIKKSDIQHMSKPVKDIWIRESREYLQELIDIVQPKHIIAMGKTAYKAVCSIYGIKPAVGMKGVIGTKISLPDGKNLFVVQHCSPLGRVGRPLEIQTGDWKRIGKEITLSQQGSDSNVNREDGEIKEMAKSKEMVQLETLPQHLETLTRKDWDKLFDLIPKIERKHVFEEFSDIILETVGVIHDLKINPIFDWMGWKEGEVIINDTRFDYHSLDTTTLCKLLTSILRADRFTEGFLVNSFSNGTMLKICKALRHNIHSANIPDVV